MEGVPLPVKGGDVGAALQGTGARARQVSAHPAAGGADTVGSGTHSRLSGAAGVPPSPPDRQPCPPAPRAPDPPVLAVTAELLAGRVQAPVESAVAAAHGDAAAACDVVVHGAWTVRDATLPLAGLRKPRIPTPGLPRWGQSPRLVWERWGDPQGGAPATPPPPPAGASAPLAAPVPPPHAAGAWPPTTFLGTSRLCEWGWRA